MPVPIKELAARDRPREKLRAKGAQALSDFELLEVIIGNGGRGVCVGQIALRLQKLIRTVGLRGLSFNALQSIPGLNTAKVCQMLAFLELWQRQNASTRATIVQAADVLPLVSSMRHKKQEYVISITLDGASRVLQMHTVAVGTLTACLVHPREVFADAIAERAASIILVHNHPSGSLEPSAKDLRTTKALQEAGVLLGIPVKDHVIVTADGYCSLRVRGLL